MMVFNSAVPSFTACVAGAVGWVAIFAGAVLIFTTAVPDFIGGAVRPGTGVMKFAGGVVRFSPAVWIFGTAVPKIAGGVLKPGTTVLEFDAALATAGTAAGDYPNRCGEFRQ